MTESKPQRMNVRDVLGLLCVVATLLLTSGVNAVRADDAEEALMSVDPALVQAEAAEDAAPEPAPASPQIIQLNTRGYNYGPPPGEIDPAAIRFEGGVPSVRTAAPAAR